MEENPHFTLKTLVFLKFIQIFDKNIDSIIQQKLRKMQ